MEGGLGPLRIRLAAAVAVELPDGRALTGQGLGSRKARTLLALLASERGRPVPVDRIADALWPDGPPADPPANIATLVSRTRRLLGPDLLTGSPGGYGLGRRDRWTLDLDEAHALAGEAGARAVAGEPALAAAAARAALDLLGSRAALADQDDLDWVLAVRREVDEERRRARHLLAEALTSLEPAAAAAVATEAAGADPLDEQAVRDLMRALVADGRPSAALTAYDDLAGRLREELGTLPDRATSALHVAVLREAELPGERRRAATSPRPSLVGREAELATAEHAWARAGADEVGHLVLVVGEAGIGKTRFLDAVADLARETGGLVLRGRCHPAERSLFLQPYLDALRPVLMDSSPARLASLVRGHEAAWVALVPDLGAVLGPVPTLAADVDLQRRQAHDAVLTTLRRLAVDRPVLLAVDDLQDGGAATVDLLGYLAGRLGTARVLVVAAVRLEDLPAVSRLRDRALTVRLEALPRSAVDALAAAAGLAGHGEQVMARTAGHPLSVVESLRALADGDAGVPDSLADAVLARVARLDEDQRVVVEAAAVLRRRIAPRLLAALLGTTELSVVRRCEALVDRRLLQRSADHYEFANDLLQECVHAALPPPVALALHRRAADLTTDQPEVMAEHAFAAGDEPRAAQGWLLAGEDALRRAAVEDAIALLDRSIAVPTAFAGTRARALLARSHALEARTDYAAALRDIDEALALARASGDRRLEMAALRARGGDPAVARRLPAEELEAPLEAGLRLAADLGDRTAEADFSSRLTVLDTSRLRLASALHRSQRAVARARAAGAEDALFSALDGLKTTWSYLGEPAPLREVAAEVEALSVARGDTWLLQWAVFEGSFAAAAEGDHPSARDLVARALEVNRRSGYPAYAGYMHAFDAWFARLAGDHEEAVRVGRLAVELSSPSAHPWWFATATGLLAATLAEHGDRREALAVARRGLASTLPEAPAAGRLRCLSAVAASSGDPNDLLAAREVLDAVDCPPGLAWVAGADCYLLVGRAALDLGDRTLAASTVEPLRRATSGSWPAVRRRLADLPHLPDPAQSTSSTS